MVTIFMIKQIESEKKVDDSLKDKLKTVHKIKHLYVDNARVMGIPKKEKQSDPKSQGHRLGLIFRHYVPHNLMTTRATTNKEKNSTTTMPYWIESTIMPPRTTISKTSMPPAKWSSTTTTTKMTPSWISSNTDYQRTTPSWINTYHPGTDMTMKPEPEMTSPHQPPPITGRCTHGETCRPIVVCASQFTFDNNLKDKTCKQSDGSIGLCCRDVDKITDPKKIKHIPLDADHKPKVEKNFK